MVPLMAEKLECIVCGRKFPRGQGITLVIGGKEYAFHSKRCALKFLRRVLEEIDEGILTKVFNNVAKEFAEELEELRKRKAKKIV